jgi:hypothetical protein
VKFTVQRVGRAEIRGQAALRDRSPAHFNPHSCDCAIFVDRLDFPRARYTAPTPLPQHLNQQIPHLAPIFLDRRNRLLKAKPP